MRVQGAPEGVQGVLEEAGYLVYAPTLPYHEPDTQWTPNQGELRAQDYVDYLKVVSHPGSCSKFHSGDCLLDHVAWRWPDPV